MLDFTEKKKKVDLEFQDEETGIHVSIGESAHSKIDEGKSYYWISVHCEKDAHHSGMDLCAASLEDAKEVASEAYEFFKRIQPKLIIQKEEGKGWHCH